MPLPTPTTPGFYPYPPAATPPWTPPPPPPAYSPPPSYSGYNAPSYNAPAAPPAPPSEPEYWYPNPGDWDESGGFRWEPETGQWLPPNFFSDLDWGGGGGEEVSPWGEPPPWWGQAAPAVPKQPARPKPPLNLPIPGTSPFLEFADQTLGYAPTAAQQFIPQWLQGLGFQGAGNVGQYGERTYKRPNADPFAFNEQNFASIADPTIRGWLRYFLGGGQLPTS